MKSLPLPFAPYNPQHNNPSITSLESLRRTMTAAALSNETESDFDRQNHSIQTSQLSDLPPFKLADQNPPCNTLSVENLSLETSEDELLNVFVKCVGFKRLCFRTKENGPMCFVEFEDISFATKALNELYGYPLHSSTNGYIRLSFSKNPLGARSDRKQPVSQLPLPKLQYE